MAASSTGRQSRRASKVWEPRIGQLGYVNFTSIPNTLIDEHDPTISLDVDVVEGKQFYISSIDITAPDAQAF
jgi:outer membrane protein assembly factor BamA